MQSADPDTSAGRTPPAPTCWARWTTTERERLRGAPRRLPGLPRGGRRAAPAARALPISVDPVDPPPELKARIMADVEREAVAARRRRARGRPAAGARARAAGCAGPRCASRGSRRRPSPPCCSSSASAIGIGVTQLGGGTPSARSSAQVADAPAQRERAARDQRRGRRALVARGLPAPPSGPRLPGVAQARRARARADRGAVHAAAATARPRRRVPGSMDGVDAGDGHRRARRRLAAADGRSAARRRPVLTLESAAEERLLASPRDGRLLPPQRPRDRGLLLELRQPDLPRLHDGHAGRDALPGVLAPDARRCGRCATMHVEPTVAYVLIAINVLMYFGQQRERPANSVYRRLRARTAPLVADGEWWRLLTPASCTAGLFHLALNMYALYFLGRMLEPALGHVRFARALLRVAAGRLVRRGAAEPRTPVVGASTAIFGLFGAAIVMARNRGIDLMASGLGPILILNLAITFFPGSTSRSAATSAACRRRARGARDRGARQARRSPVAGRARVRGDRDRARWSRRWPSPPRSSRSRAD